MWAALVLACGGPEAPEPPRTDLPDVLLVTIDTLRADHVGAYGYERDTTPNLDRLAREGVRFEIAYAPMGTTAPSHASLFTSRHPLGHGLVRNGLSLAPGERTLAQRLREAGYVTAAFVSSYPVSHRFGFARGFDHYDDDFSGSRASLPRRSWEGLAVEGVFDRPGRDTAEAALAWLAARPAARPLFVWLHLFDPHDPYRAPGPQGLRWVAEGQDRRERRRALYDAEVRYADAQFGRVLRAMEARSANDLLVVATSDHGEGLADHGRITHNRFLYEEEVRVPLVLRFPGRIPAGVTVHQPAHLIDVSPTLLDAIGLSNGGPDGEPAPRDGVSLLGFATGREPPDPERALMLQRPYYPEGRERFDERGPGFGVRMGRFKWIEAPLEERRELYDLAADPGERRNLADAQPERARALSERIAAWRAGQPEDALEQEAALSPEDRDALRALGYVD